MDYVPAREIVQETESRTGAKLSVSQRTAAIMMLEAFRGTMHSGRQSGKTYLMNFLAECDKTLDVHRDLGTF